MFFDKCMGVFWIWFKLDQYTASRSCVWLL